MPCAVASLLERFEGESFGWRMRITCHVDILNFYLILRQSRLRNLFQDQVVENFRFSGFVKGVELSEFFLSVVKLHLLYSGKYFLYLNYFQIKKECISCYLDCLVLS